jgi:hypothetical protein
MLNSVNVTVLASLFNWGAVARPNTLGVQSYGANIKTLGLCPPTPNCISTAGGVCCCCGACWLCWGD